MAAASPQQSMPKRCESWRDLKGTYRFFSNPRVSPEAMQGPHRALTRRRCREHAVVLVVQDTTELEFTSRTGMTGLGPIGSGGRGRGLLQHSAVAVTPGGRMLGVLDQRWFLRKLRPEGETRTQALGRWLESDVFGDTVVSVGKAPQGCRFVHVTDRGGDCYRTMVECDRTEAGFIIRAVADRCVDDQAGRLREWADGLLPCGRISVTIAENKGRFGQPERQGRRAELTIRFGTVTLRPPQLSREDYPERAVQVVYLREDHPEQNQTPVDWLLITSEPVATIGDARLIVEWYTRRWVIEEWHRALKEGCRLESAQFDAGEDIQRLAALLSVVAVRLINLRDLADTEPGSADHQIDRPEALRNQVSPAWIEVVATLENVEPDALTPRRFWRRVARKGGHIGRKSDGRPGWKTIWRGWYDLSQIVAYIERPRRRTPSPGCG